MAIESGRAGLGHASNGLWVMGQTGRILKLGQEGHRTHRSNGLGRVQPLFFFMTPVHISLLLKLKITEYT